MYMEKKKVNKTHFRILFTFDNGLSVRCFS